MKKSRNRLLLGLFVLLGTACAAPQHYEQFAFEQAGQLAAQAGRYATAESGLVADLHIWPKLAPPFQLRLPDGVWLNARELTRSALLAHGFVLETEGQSTFAVWRQPGSSLDYLAGRHAYILVPLDAQGNIKQLQFSACGKDMAALFRTAESTPAHGFPMPLSALAALFGPPSKTEQVFVLTGISCW